MKTLKSYINYIILGIIIILTIRIVTLTQAYNISEKKRIIAENNIKAYTDQYTKVEKNNRIFQMTISQLKVSKDSIFQELDATRKKLKIKDNKVKELQYISSTFTKVDTIKFKDTLFIDKTIKVDTLLEDNWYSLRLGVKYPSTITIVPTFKSIKNVVIHSKKETINPPKRFFLFRWFQRKHTVLNIDIIEKNPYIQKQTYRYIEVIQ